MEDAEGAWRLPAPELEAAIAVAVANILEEPTTTASLVKLVSRDRRQVEKLIQQVKSCAGDLKDDDSRARSLANIVHKVTIAPKHVSIELNVAAALPEFDLDEGDCTIYREVSLELKRLGIATRLIIGDFERRTADADPALIKQISRAFSWWESIKGGEASIEQIAQREKLSERYAREILQLAFLSPDLVESAVRGCQRDATQGIALICHSVLPVVWAEQLALFPASSLSGS